MKLNKTADSDKLDTIAARLAELGHPTRLAIFRYLIRAGKKGMPVGEIQEHLAVPGSTLSHHIAKMVKVDLIRQVRESRTLYCVPQFGSLIEVIDFLQDECCIDESR
jgi:ArsR family transcriptional regulator, arsenate/arsenite/antimonite-responsive transcriptional repressor